MVPFKGHLARRPSVFMWPISASMALRRRRSAISFGVRPRRVPLIRKRILVSPWPRAHEKPVSVSRARPLATSLSSLSGAPAKQSPTLTLTSAPPPIVQQGDAPIGTAQRFSCNYTQYCLFTLSDTRVIPVCNCPPLGKHHTPCPSH
jgi:hypothetical protein